jgi:hypothetical protein
MISPRYLVAFTGHRNLSNPAPVARALREALQGLQKRVEAAGGKLEFYGSIAYGADTLAVEAARALNIPVHLILPKAIVTDPATGQPDPRKGFAADFWDGDPAAGGTFRESDWNRAFTQIRDAQSGVNGGTIRTTLGSQVAPECYYDTGLKMLEAADALLAVWDHQEARGLGGTAEIVQMARKASKPCVIIPADGGAPEFLDIERLARDEENRAIFQQVDEFSRTCAAPDPEREEDFSTLFKRLEVCSNVKAKHFRDTLVKMIKWHGAATIVAALAAILPQVDLPWKIALAVLALTEACLVSMALWRNAQLHRGKVHEKWMETRFATELMRGLHDSGGLLDPLHPLITHHHPKWRRFAVTAGLMLRRESPPVDDWRTALRSYVEVRLRHPNWRIGQIAYFTTKQGEAEPHFHRTLLWGRIFGWMALIVVCGALAFKCYVITAKTVHLPYPHAVTEDGATWMSWLAVITFSFLPIALPLLAGVFISLRSALDSGRRTFRYKELADRLTTAACVMESLRTESSARTAVANTEEVLLDELIEWHLAEQQNGAH